MRISSWLETMWHEEVISWIQMFYDAFVANKKQSKTWCLHMSTFGWWYTILTPLKIWKSTGTGMMIYRKKSHVQVTTNQTCVCCWDINSETQPQFHPGLLPLFSACFAASTSKESIDTADGPVIFQHPNTCAAHRSDPGIRGIPGCGEILRFRVLNFVWFDDYPLVMNTHSELENHYFWWTNPL